MRFSQFRAGVCFHRDTCCDILTASADFTVRKPKCNDKRYRVLMHPDGWKLQEYVSMDLDTKEVTWNTIKRPAHPPDVIALLPTQEESGMNWDWDWRTFLLCLSFFGDGYLLGVDDSSAQWEQERARERARTHKELGI